MIRIGNRVYTNYPKFTDPSYPGFTPIVVLTKTSAYGSLGPYILTDEDGVIFENKFQFSKLYPNVPKTRETFSYWDNTVIWEHGHETHYENGLVTEAYWKWREKGMACEYPVRYPVGKSVHNRGKCICSLAETKEKGIYEILDYIDSRKKLYIPEYIRLVKDKPQFLELKQRLKAGENLLIIEVDLVQDSMLPFYREKYGVEDDWIKNGSLLVNKENLEILVNEPKYRCGHGIALSMALSGIEIE